MKETRERNNIIRKFFIGLFVLVELAFLIIFVYTN